jgi:FkbM family methyltransferase
MMKAFAKRALHKLGYDVRHYDPAQSEPVRLGRMLETHQVDVVFDVGANIGQFARSMRELGYHGRIVSFEPLPEAWEQLRQASRTDPLWEIGPRAALGAEDGEIEINVAENVVSSSILPMLDSHLKIAPDSAYVRTERVALRRLDSIGEGYLQPDSHLFIKVDAQGYEHHILKGATGLLNQTVGLHLEISFVPLYDGQVSYDHLISESKALGFDMWDLRSRIVDRQNGRILWGDAVFFRQ